MSKKNITRRDFMKAGFSCLVGAAAPVHARQRYSGQSSARAVSRSSLKELRAIPTTCEQCPAGCGVIAYLDEDRLIQILGNPEHPNNRGRICAKGIAGINLANDPERLLYPMKRKGRRGEGQWIQISWDEACHMLAKRLSSLIAEERTEAIVWDKGQDDPLLDRFLSCLGTEAVIDRCSLKSWNRDVAMSSMSGAPNLIEDVGNSRMILNFGANPYANHDQFIAIAQRLVHARTVEGARLITFDVRMSETAAKSDTWYPLRSGTDGIVALAMARAILERGLVDEEFLKDKTDISLDQLRQHLAPYTLESAERESGISASIIEELSIAFASRQPSVAMIGGGASDHENGIANVGCISLLNWLVGNLGKKGGLFYPRLLVPSLVPRAHSSDSASSLRKSLSSVRGYAESRNIDTYFVGIANPAYSDPECQETKDLLQDEGAIPFLAVMDTHLTETAWLADIVLPAATYLEGWSLKNAPSLDGYPFLELRQPVLTLLSPASVLRSPDFDVGKLLEPAFKPRGEAKEIGNLCLELGRMMEGGIAEGLPYRDTRDFVIQTLSSVPHFDIRHDWEKLLGQGFWIPEDVAESHSGANRAAFPHNQRVMLSSDLFTNSGRPGLPSYHPISSHARRSEGDFVLTTFKPNTWSPGTANSKWVREIQHDNPLWIHNEAADRLGIKNGDKVRVVSPAGSLVMHALRTGRIHPESVAIAKGLGHTALGNMAKAQPFQSEDQDTRFLWWTKRGKGVNPNAIVTKEEQSCGGGLLFKDTIVKVEKI